MNYQGEKKLVRTTIDKDKELYQSEKVAGVEFDTVVIGSGIGGLSTASLLAQQGQKVCVLEQHWSAGGCCHDFESNGYRFGTGIHYVGSMSERDNPRKLMDSLTLKDDPIVWDRMNDHFETAVFGDSHHDIVVGKEEWKKRLMERFPNEENAINEYYALIKKSKHAFWQASMIKAMPLGAAHFLTWTGLHRLFDKGFHKYSQRTVKEVLEKLTDDKELQALLAYNFGDYGVEPARAPFFLQANLASHYMWGAYYPHGGTSNIARKVIKCINSCGGKVLVKAPVKRILLDEDCKAVGVQMEDGHTIKCKNVVSDAGLINTATELLPPDTINIDFAKDSRASFGKLHPSTTGVCLFVGLRGDHRSLHIPETQYWIYPSNDINGAMDKLQAMSLDEALELEPKDFPIFVGIPSTKDKAWVKDYPGKTTMEIFTYTPWHWFEKFEEFDKEKKTHGPDYEVVKRRFAEKMWTRVVEVIGATGATLPKTIDQVDHFEVGTPLTFAKFYHREHGAFFGLDLDMKRFEPKNYYVRLRPEVPEVAGLYLTGQDIFVDGMTGASYGGLFCAAKILGLANPLSLLRDDTKVAEVPEEGAPPRAEGATSTCGVTG